MILTAINADTQDRTGSGSDRILNSTDGKAYVIALVECTIRSLPLPVLY